jgi:hypothetical protein
MTNNDSTKLMSPAELREMCICAAATAVVSYVLGCGYVAADVNNDGYGWPTRSSDVETAPWPIGDDPGATGKIATIYEAAGLASRKYRGLGSHDVSLIDDNRGIVMLDDPKIWAGVEALAAYLEGPDQGDEGVHSARGWRRQPAQAADGRGP